MENLFQKRPDPFNALIIFTTWLYVKGFLMKDKNVDRATRQESDNIDLYFMCNPTSPSDSLSFFDA